MKKRIIFIVLIAFVCTIASFGATVKRTILLHEGNLTQYDASEWQKAITDAVAGDTVYFTSGVFIGDLTIDKAITLIGAGIAETEAFYYNTDIAEVYAGCAKSAGESTTLDGNVDIAIPGAVTLTNTLMEGLRLQPGKSITVTMPVTGLIIKRCHLSDYFGGSFSATETVTNLTLEHCYFNEVNCENFVSPDIHNCYFNRIHTVPNGTNIRNCVTVEIWSTTNCNFINCCYYYLNGSSFNNFVNCLYKAGDDNSEYPNSIQVEEPVRYTKAQMEENGYLGNDNKVIGPLGGSNPFTLIPAQPYVTANNITYDSNTKKLNVSLTIKKGK